MVNSYASGQFFKKDTTHQLNLINKLFSRIQKIPYHLKFVQVFKNVNLEFLKSLNVKETLRFWQYFMHINQHLCLDNLSLKCVVTKKKLENMGALL